MTHPQGELIALYRPGFDMTVNINAGVSLVQSIVEEFNLPDLFQDGVCFWLFRCSLSPWYLWFIYTS